MAHHPTAAAPAQVKQTATAEHWHSRSFADTWARVAIRIDTSLEDAKMPTRSCLLFMALSRRKYGVIATRTRDFVSPFFSSAKRARKDFCPWWSQQFFCFAGAVCLERTSYTYWRTLNLIHLPAEYSKSRSRLSKIDTKRYLCMRPMKVHVLLFK